MKIKAAFLVVLLASVVSAQERFPNLGDSDWGWWRGPNHNGVAPANARPPVSWDNETNVKWKVEIPGRGHSSPIVVGDRIYLTTADETKKTQHVLCYEKSTGELIWNTLMHQGEFDHNNKKNSFASGSVSCDGERLYVSFFRDLKVMTSALDLDGQKLWEHNFDGFKSHQGFGCSPLLYKGMAIVAIDNKGAGGGALIALDTKTGEELWRTSRPQLPNYVSPVIYRINGKDQIFMAGCNLIASYDPMTGKVNWQKEGTTEEVVGNVATDGEFIFSSGGYPKRETWCWKADGTGDLVWKNTVRTYVPSMLVLPKHLFTVTDDSIGYMWDKQTGKEIWKQRLSGGFSASPILANGHIYVCSEAGTTWVFKSQADGVELVSKNQLGTGHMATPAFSGNQIFLRAIDESGPQRKELLVCVSK